MPRSSGQGATASCACRCWWRWRPRCWEPPDGCGRRSPRGLGKARRVFDTLRATEGYSSAMPLSETEEDARRLARAIASDLSLYNEEKIIRGIESDSLFEELREEIEEGRALYKSRVSQDLYHRNFY